MTPKTPLASGLDITANKAAYDKSCKLLLSEKHILAWILRTCAEEFSDMDIDTIVKECLGGQMDVEQVPVAPHETGAFLQGREVGITSPAEGNVYFDILFDAIVPAKDESVRLVVNVEAQTDFYPGYSLLRRGVYYCARLLSAQGETIFPQSHYEKLCKVYSIWICLQPPKHRQNTITRYHIAEENIVGSVKANVSDYDLLSIVTVCLGDINDSSCQGLLRLLAVLLSDELRSDTKKQIISEEYKIPMTQALDEEVSSMGSFSDALIMKGVNKGFAKGRAEGRAEGHAEGLDEGLAKGRAEGCAEERVRVQSSIIRQAMHFKFGGVTDEQMQTLLRYCDDDNLLTRILQAESLEALLMSLQAQP